MFLVAMNFARRHQQLWDTTNTVRLPKSVLILGDLVFRMGKPILRALQNVPTHTNSASSLCQLFDEDQGGSYCGACYIRLISTLLQ